MIQVYFIGNKSEWAIESYQTLLKKMPEAERVKNVKYIRWQDRQSRILGKLLLQYGLAQLNLYSTLDDLVYTKYHKPYLIDGPSFNISHSGEYVVCAFSNDSNIGIDIEELKPIDTSDFKSVFTDREWNNILQAENSLHQFYDYWTKKESAIKANGKGLHVPLTEMDVTGASVQLENETWHLKKIEIQEDYRCYVATPKEKAEAVVEEVPLSRFL